MAFTYELLSTLAELPLGRDTLKVEVKRNNGKVVVDVRRWFTGDDDELHATQKGVSIPVDLFEDAQAALELAFAEAADVAANDEADKAAKAKAKANGAKKAPARKTAARKAPAKKAAGRRRPAPRARKTAAKK